MSDLKILEQKLLVYRSTLKQTSWDKTNNAYLCESEREVYNFENFVQQNEKTKKQKNFDALLIEGNQIFCIEFKNEKYSDIDSHDIQGKYQDGLSILEELLGEVGMKKRIEEYQFFFFVVYKNPTNMTAYHSRGFANQIQFGLDACRDKNREKYIFRNTIIKTEPQNFFRRRYRKLCLCE